MRNCWARNLLLVGDEHWGSLKEVTEDVATEVDKLEREWRMRIVSRPGETLDRMYDAQREKLLFALPKG